MRSPLSLLHSFRHRRLTLLNILGKRGVVYAQPLCCLTRGEPTHLTPSVDDSSAGVKRFFYQGHRKSRRR